MTPMARAHNKQQKKKPQSKTPPKIKPVSKVVPKEAVKPIPKREATKNEILFFRVGIMVVAITIITVAIIFTIQYFMNQEEEAGIYDDYIHITAIDLRQMTFYDEDFGVYGDFSFFMGKEDYEDIYDLINQNNTIYFFVYRSSNINTEIEERIKSLDLDGFAFFMIDADLASNGGLFTDTDISHLGLDESRQHMLVIFDVDQQT